MPYVCKDGSKEFNNDLFLLLSSIFYRLTDGESAHSSNVYDDGTTASQDLPILKEFVCDFLITDLMVRRGTYPGTISDKEEFALGLLQCIISFASQDESVKPKARRQRESRMIETTAMNQILTFLLGDEPMSALFSLLHSMWDNTRTAAFACLCRLLELAHARNLVVSNRFSAPESIRYIQARAIYLASSPRQREADTGSKLLALIAATCKTEDARREHAAGILTLLSERLDITSRVLGVVFSTSSIDEINESGDNLVGDGTKMPMAHGLMMALRLVVNNHSMDKDKNNTKFYTSFASICCRALQLSLSVVADLKKEGTTIDDEESWSDEYESSSRGHSSSAPLNVNTGAIGANAGFSSIQEKGEDDALRRFALQRIIVSGKACAN